MLETLDVTYRRWNEDVGGLEPLAADAPVFVLDMPNDEYHAGPGVSSSNLKDILRSPAHYRYAPPKPASRAMDIGTAIHTAILEPDRFEAEYMVLSCDNRTRSEYKQATKVHPPSRVLTAPEADKITGMQAAVYASDSARQHLTAAGLREVSVFARDPETGVICRVRPDLVTSDLLMIDVKKCQDARPDEFARSAARFGYELSAALYCDVWYHATGQPLQAYALLAVEEEPPHGIGLYVLGDDWLERGRRLYREALQTYARCSEADEWPAYPDEPKVLTMPRWLQYQEQPDGK